MPRQTEMPDSMMNRLEGMLAGRSNVMINHYDNDISEMAVGIVFLYAGWSPGFLQLRHLRQSLENYPCIPLYIFDVDEEGASDFFIENGLASHGWGETYWIKGGVIIASMDKYTEKQQQQLLSNHKLFI